MRLTPNILMVVIILLRPTALAAIFGFVAGGVLTIKSEHVREAMFFCEEVFDYAIQPAAQESSEKIKEIIDKKLDGYQ